MTFMSIYLSELQENSLNLAEINDPCNYEEAIRSRDFNEWLKAMNEELHSIEKNNVWEQSDLLNDRKL